MKWLSAGLTFVNLSVVCGLLLGMVGHGLNALSAALALICGVAFAAAAWLGTSDPDKPAGSGAGFSKPTSPYGKIWFWLVAAFFALFQIVAPQYASAGTSAVTVFQVMFILVCITGLYWYLSYKHIDLEARPV